MVYLNTNFLKVELKKVELSCKFLRGRWDKKASFPPPYRKSLCEITQTCETL